jgi:hypothetical protein
MSCDENEDLNIIKIQCKCSISTAREYYIKNKKDIVNAIMEYDEDEGFPHHDAGAAAYFLQHKHGYYGAIKFIAEKRDITEEYVKEQLNIKIAKKQD